jgi:titin
VTEPTANLIANNDIGTDAARTKVLANGAWGVFDSGSEYTYDGTTPGLGNVMSGNHSGGLKSVGSITIEGNYLGTDETGNSALGDGAKGFGGITAEQGAGDPPVLSTIITNNVVSGNLTGGIAVSSNLLSAQATYEIANNFIGTKAAGSAALGNGTAGVELTSLENVIVQDNVISSNHTGLSLSGFGPDVEHNVIQGNLIGTDVTGKVAIGNSDVGIIVSSAIGTTIGSSGPG